MKVFLDARMFYHSGIGRYGRNLYRELLRLTPPPRISLGLDEQVRLRLAAEMNCTPNVIPFNAPIYSLREQLWGAYLGQRYRQQFDLFHFPHYNIPWVCPSPTVVTTHGLSHLLFPQYFDPLKVSFARRLLQRVANQAKAIIAVSSISQQAFLRFFPRAEGKLRVIYNGVGAEFQPLPARDIAEFKHRRQLGDFLLYVGICKPLKNLPRLIAAYAQIKIRYPGLRLVILSQDIYNSEVAAAISRWKVEEGVILCQPSDSHQLVLYYNAARLLVFPSLYEGFGLPPLEAMACGTPVVASNLSSIPEVVGGAAILIDPAEVEAIVVGIERGLSDSLLRERLRQAGLERAKKFSWQKTAQQTWQVYQEVAKGN